MRDMTRTLRALTVMEPFAWLLVDLYEVSPAGAKNVENRHQRFPKIKGHLLIHSGKGEQYARSPAIEWASTMGRRHPLAECWPSFEQVRGRGLIGLVNVADTVPVESLPRAWQSPWAQGPQCLLIDNVIRFPEPIPYRGVQGIFHVDYELVRNAIREGRRVWDERLAIQTE